MKRCNTCDMEFEKDELKLTCQGFGCPYCGSINYNESAIKKPPFKWNEVKVTYKEGHHD